MSLIIELIRWYWANTIHKYHVACNMYFIIKGLNPSLTEVPLWRSDSYFWECVSRDDGDDIDELKRMRGELLRRLLIHDLSKYRWKEAKWFLKENQKLRKLTYRSKEYLDALDRMRPGIEEHYKANRHHPEWHEQGLRGMNLIDELEMICDWAAATKKHDDGNILISIYKNQERFGYDADRARFYEMIAEGLFTKKEWSVIEAKYESKKRPLAKA